MILNSGYGRDETVAKALEAGAAENVVKPFSPTELVIRVRAALHRRDEPEPFVSGDLAIDYGCCRATVADEAVELTATEYELLRIFVMNPGRNLGDNAANPAWIFNERRVGYHMAGPDEA